MSSEQDDYVPGSILEQAIAQMSPPKHDDEGMYIVKEIGEARFDVVQRSSQTIVASCARRDTADTAAAGLNACAVIPRLTTSTSPDENKPTIINEKSYAPSGQYTPHATMSLSVEAILDMVPGAFHDPEDLMRWICGNPYVRSVTLEKKS